MVNSTDISLKINKGEFIGLVGANGIGKSTLLKTLSNIQPALRGRIDIAGKPLHMYNVQELAFMISLVLTEPLGSKNMTVEELVALGRYPYTNWMGKLLPEDMDHIYQAIDAVQMTKYIHHKCYTLSDGQLQKVLIARALAQQTPIMLLDEPTAHLDIYHKAYVFNFLKQLASETHKTILIATHEIDFAIQLCDKIIIMTAEGFEFGRPKELIQCKAFSNLFPDDLIIFDSQLQKFRIRSAPFD